MSEDHDQYQKLKTPGLQPSSKSLVGPSQDKLQADMGQGKSGTGTGTGTGIFKVKEGRGRGP